MADRILMTTQTDSSPVPGRQANYSSLLLRWRCGLERALEAHGPEGAEFGALAELGGVGRRGAVDFYVVGGVVDVAEIGEERETARERILNTRG